MPTPRGADRLVTLAVLGLGALFLARAVLLLSSPIPVEYGEGTTWSYARLIASHGTYFLPIADAPWIHATYPPLFPRLQAALGGSLQAGRALGLFGSLLAAFSLGAILVAQGVAARRAALWGVVFLAAPAAHEWGALCRVDTLALGLTLFGLWLTMRAGGRPARGELVALPFLAAAFFAKQIALAGPVAVALSLRLRGERRRALVFAASYVTLVGLCLALLQWRTGGEMWRHLVTYTGAAGLAPGPFVRFLLRLAFTFPVLLPLGLKGLGSWSRSTAGVYVLVALATLVLAGKPGAAANYLLEPSAAVVLAGGLAAEQRRRELAALPERRRDLDLLLLVQLAILCGPVRPVEVRDLLRERAVARQVVEELASVPGPVLSEDLGLTLAAGKEPLFEPFQFALLARAGRFDPAPVLLRLRAGEFGAVALGWRLREVPGLAAALEEGYARAATAGPFEIWRPRAAAAGR